MQLLVADIYQVPDCGNILEDNFYSVQNYCDSFPATAALFRYKVAFSMLCLTFLCVGKTAGLKL